jgi:hypothetical protein
MLAGKVATWNGRIFIFKVAAENIKPLHFFVGGRNLHILD